MMSFAMSMHSLLIASTILQEVRQQQEVHIHRFSYGEWGVLR